MKLQATFTTTLTASNENRIISGLLLPFNQEGYTNLGRLTAGAHSLTLPQDPIILNVEHDHTRPIGKSIDIKEASDGLEASFTVAETAAGNDALAEVSAGLRACLSVEIDNPVIRGGRLLAGTVTGAALVARPAFPDAKLAASLVEDLGETEDEDEETDERPEESPEESPEDEEKDDEMKNLNAHAPASTKTASTMTGAKTSRRELFQMIAGARVGDQKMLAALSNVTETSIPGINLPQYVGELWDGKAYERQFIPAFNHAALESYKIQGWRWKTRPTVAAYSGNLSDVPSAAIETEAVEIIAERIAGAHKIDKKHIDFNDQDFWAAYFAAMTESYARVSDTSVLADVKEGATKIKAGEVPTGIAAGLVYIIDGILAIMKETDTVADTAFVAPGLYRDILLTRHENVLGYLNAALGFEDGTIRNFTIKPTAQIDEDKVLVTCKDAVTVHELGGAAPIRVDALDIAKGGIDSGVFGYYAVNIHDKGGLALVSKTGQ